MGQPAGSTGHAQRRRARRSAMARAPESADSQVEKDRRGDDGKIAGNGVAAESGPVLPKAQSEDGGEQKKEEACDFEPNDAAYTLEGTQESAHAPAGALPGLGCDLLHGLGCSLGLLETAGERHGLPYAGARDAGAGLRMSCHPLPHNAPGDANADAQGAANDSRSHPVYDGSSGHGALRRPPQIPGCSSTGMEVR